jgi:two-component system, sensor histidine kinase and response regulator
MQDIDADRQARLGALNIMRTRASKYAMYGTLIAVASVIIGTVLVAYFNAGHVNVNSIAGAQNGNIALWVLDCMPFVFAAWGQYASLRMTHEASKLINENTRDLRSALKEEQVSSQAKSDFFARMSHELRAPLNGIVGMSELLSGGELSTEQRRQIGIIQSSAQNLLNLINDILDLSKIEAGKLLLENVEFNLQECIESAVAVLGHSAQRKELKVSVRIQRDAPRRLSGDPGRLRQIIINLVSNAIKFTDNGEIMVSAQILGLPVKQKYKLHVEVTDSGIGISAEEQAALFQPYRQAGGDHGRKHQGTGLGLAITRELVEAMGGEIGVVSAPGKGSRFWFSAHLGEVRPAAAVAGIDAMRLEGLQVLVVDANDSTRVILADQLRALGMEAEEARDGIEALQKALLSIKFERPFDLVLTDIFLPHMSGDALGQELKQRTETAQMVLAVVTHSGARGDAARLNQMGFAGYFGNGILPSDLREAIAALMDTRALAEDARRSQGLVTRYSLIEHRRQARHLLLVDDSAVDREVSLRAINELGCSADAAATAAEAVAALERNTYNVMLLDMHLPDGGGPELLQRVRALGPVTGRMPVVVLTAGLSDSERRHCRDNGVKEFLIKPVERELFRQTLAKFVPLSADSDPAGAEQQRLLMLFFREAIRRIGVAKAAFDAGDTQSIAAQAHTLRSITTHVQADDMHATAERVEALAKAGKLKQIKPLLEELKNQLVAFRYTHGEAEDPTIRVAPN